MLGFAIVGVLARIRCFVQLLRYFKSRAAIKIHEYVIQNHLKRTRLRTAFQVSEFCYLYKGICFGKNCTVFGNVSRFSKSETNITDNETNMLLYNARWRRIFRNMEFHTTVKRKIITA